MDRFAEFDGIAAVLGRGETKMSIRLGNGLANRFANCRSEAFGAALVYFTGSKAHNVVLRGMAKDRGLKINEYGVFQVAEAKIQSSRRDSDEGSIIAGRTEKEVYDTLDLPWIPPELREDRWEFAWAAEGELPKADRSWPTSKAICTCTPTRPTAKRRWRK